MRVVIIHSVEQDGDVHFIVMEYLDGRSLADAIPAAPLQQMSVRATLFR